MNISKKCMELFNKFMKVGGKYLKMLLIIIGVAVAFFVGHKFDVNADDGTSHIGGDYLYVLIKPNRMFNMPAVSSYSDYYNPFMVDGEYNDHSHIAGSFDLSGPGENGTEDNRYFNGSAEKKPKEFGDKMDIRVNEGYEVIDNNGVYHPKADGDPFIGNVGLRNDKTRYEYTVKCVGIRPKVIVKNLDGYSYSGNVLEAPIRTSGDFTLTENGYTIRNNRVNIDRGIYSPVTVQDLKYLNLVSGAASFEYDSESQFNDRYIITGYTGNDDIVFDCIRKVYFGSATNGQSGSPWQNATLAGGYTLTAGDNVEVEESDDKSKGAWMIRYSADSKPGSWNLTLEAKLGYEFEDNCPITNNNDSVTGSLDSDHKKLTFTINNKSGEQKDQIVKIGGQKYTQYTNTFKYVGDRKLNTFISRPQYQSGISTWANISGWANNSNVGTDVWSLSDSYRTSTGEFNSNYRFGAANAGYYVGDATITCDNEAVSNVSYDSGTGIKSFMVSNKSLGNHTIVIDNVKEHYDVTFKPKEGTSVDSDININGDALNWNKSITGNTDLGGKFTVDLDLTNNRKTFKNDKTAIERAIIGANTDLDGLTCEIKNATKVTLTIPHGTSAREIKIPDTLFDWKNSNVDFSIDFRGVSEIYEEEAFQSLKLYKGTTISDENLIELKKSGSYDIVNASTQTGVPYGSLTYTINLADSTYLDLSEAKVDIDNAVDGEVAIESQSANKLTFKLNPNCAGASYRENIKFKVSGLKSSLKDVSIKLCAKAILYLKKSDGSLKHIVTAPSDFGTQVNLEVPATGGANYEVMYPDYSKIFKEDNITGNCIDAESIKLDSFNRVSFRIVPNSSEASEVECRDPAETAPPVKFTPVEGVKYYNVRSEGTIDLSSPIQGTVSMPYGQKFAFAVKCNEGYDDSTLEIRANGTDFSDSGDKFKKEKKDDYYVFTIASSEAVYPITITGNVQARQHKIIFNKSLGGNFGECGYIYNGASVGDNITVLYGQGIAFEVTLPEKCNQSDIKVKFNDEELPKVNGKYIKNNITSDGTITVTNASLNKYPVTFASNSRATYKNKDGSNLSGTVSVSHGDNFEFRVQPNAGYTLGQDSVVYLKYSDGRTTTLQPNNDVYKINKLDQACTVSVENVEDIIYTIKLIPADGVTYLNDVDNVIKDTVKIKHGRNFEFSVSLSDEYDDSLGGMNIIVNDGKSAQSSAKKLASGRYVITNVVEDMTIKVGNVRKNTYTVSLMGAEGIDYYDSSGRVITGDNQVDHHSDFSFKVDLYPAYLGSNITVMLGDTPMNADSNGFYTIHKISESKTVTVVGIERSSESELTNKINNLPDTLGDLSDVDDVIAATKAYESLSESQKASVGNADKLKALQEQVKAFHHVSNDVKISGVDWHIKLYAIPITDDTDACGRIYKKLGSEYILSLYNVYLWDTLSDTRYTLPEGQRAVITLPTPDMTYFEKPTAIHEKDNGKIDFITPSISSDSTVFETDSFSPMGIVANRSSTPGRSSLLDAIDVDKDAISNFAASLFGNDTNKVSRSGSGDDNYSDLSSDSGGDELSGNIDEKFRSRNNRTTPLSSALRLILVIMVLVLIGLGIYFFIKRRKENKNSDEK